jgi:spore coat protein U-like protein
MTGRSMRLAAILSIGLGLNAPLARAVSCTVSTSGIAFGSYDVLATSALDVAGALDGSCSTTSGDNPPLTASYTISLTGGVSVTFSRQMASGTNRLNYNLYIDSIRSVVWGDGTAGTSKLSGGPRLTPGQSSKPIHHDFYGRVPALQDVSVGSYTDNLTITVDF